MEYSFEEHGNAIKISMAGKMVAGKAEEIKEKLQTALEKKHNLVLDFSGVTDIDSTGLGALVYLLHKAKSMDGNVKLACIQPRPRIVFDVTKVYRVFDIFDSVEAALDSFDE